MSMKARVQSAQCLKEAMFPILCNLGISGMCVPVVITSLLMQSALIKLTYVVSIVLIISNLYRKPVLVYSVT
jgi:hypothetical protein